MLNNMLNNFLKNGIVISEEDIHKIKILIKDGDDKKEVFIDDWLILKVIDKITTLIDRGD